LLKILKAAVAIVAPSKNSHQRITELLRFPKKTPRPGHSSLSFSTQPKQRPPQLKQQQAIHTPFGQPQAGCCPMAFVHGKPQLA
jgi:hypothetical protein